MVPMGVDSVGKARMLHLKGLGSSFAASSPPWWVIYKSNVSPLWDLWFALALVWGSFPLPKLSLTKKKKKKEEKKKRKKRKGNGWKKKKKTI